MKKILLLTLLTLASIEVFSQEVISDNVQNDIRCIETSSIIARSFTDRVVWIFGLKGYGKGNSETQYELTINLNAMNTITFPENATLLIKLFDDTIIDLKCVDSYQGESIILGYSYNRPLIGNVGTFSENKVTRNIASFIITEEQLQLLKKGVKKVRVQTTAEYEEKEYKKDKCGEKLYQSYLNILNKFKTKPSTVYDGF